MTPEEQQVPRVIHLNPELDDMLRAEAFKNNISKNELIRRYLIAGLTSNVKPNTDLMLEALSI